MAESPETQPDKAGQMSLIPRQWIEDLHPPRRLEMPTYFELTFQSIFIKGGRLFDGLAQILEQEWLAYDEVHAFYRIVR